jgi:hypothetical protein
MLIRPPPATFIQAMGILDTGDVHLDALW